MNKVKKIISSLPIFALTLIFGSGLFNFQHVQQDQQAQPAQITPLPIVQQMVDQVSKERILTDLRRLSGVDPICVSNQCTTITNRFTGSDGLQWAQDYVKETLINLHYSVEVLDWSSSGFSDENILAHKRGVLYPNEEIYFIAHLDCYAGDNQQKCLGADDDASGAVALLEIARLLAKQNLSRSVTLFFSSGEEKGSLGSNEFVTHYPDRLNSIQYLVSAEMLGYDSNDDRLMELWSPTENTDFQNMLREIITAYSVDVVIQVLPSCT